MSPKKSVDVLEVAWRDRANSKRYIKIFMLQLDRRRLSECVMLVAFSRVPREFAEPQCNN